MGMEFFTVLPMWNYSGKKIAIIDSNREQIGFIQRKYKNLRDKIIHYSPITIAFLETINIDGEDNGIDLKIREHSFKSNLIRLKWDIFLKENDIENKFLLEDKTKISTNPRMIYHKGEKEYIFKKDLFNRTCEIVLNGRICATVRMEKKIPPSLRTVIETEDLTIVELIGIYYILILTY